MTAFNGFARIGSKPTLRYVPDRKSDDQVPVAELRICMINYRMKGDDSEDRGFWVTASLWHAEAEIAAQNLKVGDKIFVMGQLSEGRWPNKETGEEMARLEATLSHVFLDMRSLESFRMKPRSRKGSGSQSETEAADPNPIQDDDIPFSGGTETETLEQSSETM